MDTQVAATAAAAVAGKVCRLCFAGGGSDDLQLSSVRGTKSLLKRIYDCTSVQITSGEGGIDQNAQLCQPCVDRIDDFYAYRALCRTNNDHIRQLVQGAPEQAIKQEKQLDLDDDEGEDSSRHHPPTANEIAAKSTPKTKDVKKQQLFLQSNQFLHTDEITIKREALPEEDADVYYNSEGEPAATSTQPQLNSSKKTTGSKNYRIIIAPNNRERLVYGGYLYCRHFTRRDGSTHWRCRLNKCQAAVNLLLDESIVSANSNGHCHARNAPEELLGAEEEEDEQDGIVDSEMVEVEAESLVYTMNKKQGETLIHLGFRYCKRYQKMDGSTFWKCRANGNKCLAGVYVYPEAKVKYHGQHNHDKVVEEDGEQESVVMEGGYTICEDVEDEEEEEEGERDYSEDIAALLSSSLEVMMPEEKKQAKQQQQYGVEDYEITTNVKGRECLIFEGHQYSKDRERVDGAVYWRCRRNYDKCRALAIVMPDGRIEKCGDHLHDTDKRHLERQEQGGGSRFYRIIKNQRGNDAFVFEGHRFSKEWSRVDGSIIWRCSYRSGVCRVKVVLNADGYVYRMGTEHEHDHETTEPPVTEEVPLDEDVEFVEDSPLRRKLIPAAPCASNVPTEVQAAGGYRITRNRKGYEALIHDGYRYCKIRVRQDGSVKWLCKMNKKTCRAAVELFPDGSLVKSSEYDHNHERPVDEGEDEEDVDGLAQEVTYPMDPDLFGKSQFFFVKNSKNGMSMIHANYRYTKKCDRVDGTSLWRCSAAQRGCKAGVILFPNDTLAMVENAEHSHKPYDSVPRGVDSTLETAPPSPDVIEINETDDGADSEMNMHSLLQTVLGADEDGWMANESTASAAAENESVWFNSTTDRPYPRPDGPATFRIIKNRRNTDSLVHRGYRYCKIRDRVDGSILWACQMNKKTCKASVNLTTDGRVEVLNGMHNHVKTDVDDIGGYDDGEVRQVEATYYAENGAEVDLGMEEIEPTPAPAPEHRVPAPKHPDYFYSLNKSNRECLIHRGYRFCKPVERPDGTTTWRCSMGGNTCMAVVTIHADGTPQENDFKHNHQPLAEMPPEVEKMVVVKAPTPTPPPPEEEEEKQAATPHKRQGDTLEWNGFHYRKIKELPDGSVIWICQIDSCRVAVKMLPHGQLKMLSESEHNHTASGPLVGSNGGSSCTVVKPSTAVTGGGRNRSYRLFKNQRGQMTLLYDGYRYSIRNRNQDGSSSWKCRANSTCRVIIFLMPDDRIVVGNNNTEHNHEPNWESTRKLEAVAAPTRVNPLYDYLNIIPGGSAAQVVSKAPASSAAPAVTPDACNFGRNVIEHKGYYYRLVVRKKNGREYWRCVHFKNRACRAALFCRDTGAIVISSNGKDHSHGGGAAAMPVPSATPARQPVEPVQPRIVAQPSPPDEVQLTEADEERYIDHGEYVIAKNRKDQNTLIFKDRRYYLSYNRSDGSAVWRCAHRKRYKCYAYVRLRPDGRLLSTGEQEHSHASTAEEPTAVEGQQQQPQQEPLETRNYRIVKNRVGNDILIHDSHRFRLNYQRNDGTTHWRCIWARSNHCSAGVYRFPNGLLKNAANEAAIIHNHPPPSAVKKAAAAAAAAAKVSNPAPQSEAKDDVVVVVTSADGAPPPVHPAHRTIPEPDGITDYRFVEEGNNKILVCRGYRYWYTWIRKDGSIYYRCAEVKKRQCPFGVLLLASGRVIRSNDTCHNHDGAEVEVEEEFLGFPAETPQAEVAQPKAEEEEAFVQYPPLVIPEGGDADFKVIKTSRGESLIYKGYRYWAKNRLTNGTVSLCCTRKKVKKCPAMLRLLTDGRVMDPVGMGHTHAPSVEGGGMVVPILPELPPAITVTPIPRPPSVAPIRVKVPAPTPVAQLPALSFNEESDDECDEGDEAINGSKRYLFMKSSAQRNYVVFQGFVYDFEHKQHDGCVFYRCKTSEACPASLMLLTNGRVMAMDDALHQHDKPDLGVMRPVGRGSKEFKIVQNKNGSNILVHRGHRYTTPRAKTDGAGIWYCHTYIPNVNRRCYVPIELLPNGRVAPVGDKQHDHKPPYKAKPDNADSDSALDGGNAAVSPEQPQKVGNRMLLLAGHRYNLAHRREDGAVLWKCARKGCNGSMYRLTDGTISKGPEHNHEKMESISTSASVKRKHSEVDRTGRHSDPTRANPYIGQSIINEGFRYIYYLTRRDGTEHWRCCRRIPLKCRGALLKQSDGTLVKSNDEGHNHPADHDDQPDYVPFPSVPTEPGAAPIDLDDDTVPEPPVAPPVEDEGSYDYELIDVKGKKRGLYLIHRGAMVSSGGTRGATGPGTTGATQYTATSQGRRSATGNSCNRTSTRTSARTLLKRSRTSRRTARGRASSRRRRNLRRTLLCNFPTRNNQLRMAVVNRWTPMTWWLRSRRKTRSRQSKSKQTHTNPTSRW
uniref:ZAD domain-containing protein n=1 Tax=Culex tarsalis TaxID=7177 RepID=A0A1Q3FW80_CULTA